MREGAPRMGSGPGDHARGTLALAILLVLPATVLAGCIAEPSTQLELRRGDLARIELVVTNGTDLVYPANASAAAASRLCGASVPDVATCPASEQAYLLRSEPAASLPSAWSTAQPLPAALIEALSGLSEGATLTREDVQIFGPHRDALVETHPLETSVPRVVEAPEAYGRTWNTTRAGEDAYRIEPGPEANGTSLRIDRWCNQRFCLFESQLTGYNGTHLKVRHQPASGDRVDVDELDTRLVVTHVGEETFRVDGNPPHAGESFDVFARVVDIRGPPEGTRRAPGFQVTTLNGTQLRLSELTDRPVVLEFFATWCPSCVKNTEHLSKLEARFGDQIHILAIGVDPWESSKALRSFIQQNDVTWPVAVDEDGRISQAYHVGSLSTEVIVSQQGAIVHTETGVADHDRVASVLDELLEHGHDHGAHPHGSGEEATS